MPAADIFVDTNILLYAHDRHFADKRARCLAWLRFLSDREQARVNLQVLNELTSVLLRKRWFETEEQVFDIVDAFSAFGAAPLTSHETDTARSLRKTTGYSWWDCLLLASAIELGCTHFLSEDLQDGQKIAIGHGKGLTIVDPFAHSPDEILSLP
jgi:predicted nucleic acid-binding protein